MHPLSRNSFCLLLSYNSACLYCKKSGHCSKIWRLSIIFSTFPGMKKKSIEKVLNSILLDYSFLSFREKTK